MNNSILVLPPFLSVPDRYESLVRTTSFEQIQSIVKPVNGALVEIDRVYGQMRASHRGAFLVLRGNSGSGKSTFLHTISQFRSGAWTESVPGNVDIRAFFSQVVATHPLHIFVIEEREAAISFSDRELEEWLHAINGYIRTSRGERALVVWPCNTDELLNRIVSIARAIGADALLGLGQPFSMFDGPEPSQFREIAETTIAVLNQGASFADLGLSDSLVMQVAGQSTTIGSFLGGLRNVVQQQEQYVNSLLSKEQARLWVIVAAGNEPGQEVAALTRGRYAALDIERLMTSTEANIVKELKSQPEKLGILATTLDARLLHLPVLSALAIARAFAADNLKLRMKAAGLSLKPDSPYEAIDRLLNTELARIFAAQSQSTLTGVKKPGPQSVDAFEKLAEIASTNDTALNRAIASALQAAGLISEFALEQDFGVGLARRSDILASWAGSRVRVEVMWRRRTSRAEIANYTLTKLANYGKALGYMS